MVRIGLSIYLVLTMAAGPSLCCCLPARLAQMLPIGNGKSGQDEADTHEACCCHHHPHSAPHGQKAPSQDQGKPDCPDSPTCPCKQPGLNTALPTQDAQHSQASASSDIEGLGAFVPATALTCPPSLAVSLSCWGQGTALPFLSAHDFLTALHILRC